MAKTKRTNKGKSTAEIQEEVTDLIINALEDGVVPWRRPWRVLGGVHRNWKTKKPYRGINQFLLDITAQSHGYKSPYWMTYKQANEESYKQYRQRHGLKDAPETEAAYKASDEYRGVRKGEESSLVVFWKIQRFEKRDEENDEDKIITVPLLRHYRVFNSEQTDLDIPMPEQGELREHSPIEEAQSIIDGCPNPPVINHGGDRAFYRPSTDQITLPTPEQFDSDEHYYSTSFHELIHATGHEDRTGRVTDWTTFGSDPYAKEELVAEIGAAILAGHADIDVPEIQTNTASYIQSWIKRLNNDKTLIVSAGGKAQVAVDYILDTKFEDVDNTRKER
jgi:antirestriction protein ArdC